MKKSIYTKQQKKLQKLLKSLRLKVGLSQERLAKILGKPQSFVSKYESGERRLDLLELRQLCEVLDVPLSELVQQLETAIDETKP